MPHVRPVNLLRRFSFNSLPAPFVQLVTRAARSARRFVARASFSRSVRRSCVVLVRFVASTVVLDCLAELSVEPVRVEIRNNRNVRDVLIRRICFRS